MTTEAEKDIGSRTPRDRPTREVDQTRPSTKDLGPRTASAIPMQDVPIKGHPPERCLLVCRGCGETHEVGKCPMEEFYNLIRHWYNPTKHAGMLPEKVEQMLN
ncbi:unnamed protein product [Peronospora belbahrii]|uniref:Uncharacterized protein n=1 Tax=Peronospora belbahrii TaxID=622444 RepID=A0ABN8DDR9_9STRA|nr:unnamed protein product [Peronospora belbahrii]